MPLFRRSSSFATGLVVAFVAQRVSAQWSDPCVDDLGEGNACSYLFDDCFCSNNQCVANCGEISCNVDQDCDIGEDCDVATKFCVLAVCPDGTDGCGDPHMKGLSGQAFDWSGVDGGWYSLIKDDAADLHVNLRVTAPLPQEFPDRQLITGFSVQSAGHSLVIEVKNPYSVETGGCPAGVSPCLADGGLCAMVDGVENNGLLTSLRQEKVADGIAVSASNLPAECRQFGADKIWARMYDEMVHGRRQLSVDDRFEDWVLRFETMAAPDWCALFIEQHDLADVQSIHAVFKIVTAAAAVRLNVGTNYQGNGELDWDGRVLPDIEFWQMDVGLDGLVIEHASLTGLLGETARPVMRENGRNIMKGFEAFRGTVEDYRVDGPLGTDFALLHQ